MTCFPRLALAASLALILCGSASADLITRDVGVTLNAANLESYDLDLDLDGQADFTFTAALVPDFSGFDTIDLPFGSQNGVVIDTLPPNGFPSATRLAPGALVSASDMFSFDQTNLFFFTIFDPPSGNFGGQTGFVGLRFESGGATLLGFAEITVNALDDADDPLGLRIGVVGYETVPGLSVRTVPEPASAGLLGLGLLGAAGLAAKRRARRGAA